MDYRDQQFANMSQTQQQQQRDAAKNRDRDQDQVVIRIAQFAELEAAQQRVGLSDEIRIYAPDQLNRVLEDQERAHR